MSVQDPFGLLLGDLELARAVKSTREAIARVHRRPTVLRRADVVSSESLVRGARASLAIDGTSTNRLLDDLADVDNQSPFACMMSAYSLLAPGKQVETVRTFLRAPMQVLARIDVAMGGEGFPVAAPGRVQQLAELIVKRPSGEGYDSVMPAVLHGEIAAGAIFGERSRTLGRLAARIAAVATGFDPQGICVPETYMNRHRARYEDQLAGYQSGDQVGFIRFQLDAWKVGAKEADGIARAA